MTRLMGVRFAPPAADLDAAAVARQFVGPVGLYVHIPFCSRLCPFCPYNKVAYRPRQAREYLPLLEKEVRAYLAAFRSVDPDFLFTSLYVGGGTPTLALAALDWLREIPVAGERAIEVLPSHMTPRIADRLTDLGFDAVSLGVQSFHDDVLTHLQRPTDAATNRRAVELARQRFDVLDIDLIFDVGYADPQTFLEDLAASLRTGADQVSTYPLMRFGYTPFGKAHHDRNAEHEVLRRASDLAATLGYRRDSVWTFVRADAPIRYTSITRPYYLGTGAGAASFTGPTFQVNHFGLTQYAEDVAGGRLPIARVATLSPPLASAYRQFWQAYTGVLQDGSVADPLLEHPVARAATATARRLGLARREGSRTVLTPAGYDRYHDLERWVTYRLIEPLWADLMQEHASAA